MAVPKKKTSKQRKRKRRTHWKLKVPNNVRCSHCGAANRSHRVCAGCGHYGETQVLDASD